MKRINDNHLLEADEGMPFLLKTIKFPKAFHYLTEKLPKANYNPIKLQKIEKQAFIQTLFAEKKEKKNESPSKIILPKIKNHDHV